MVNDQLIPLLCDYLYESKTSVFNTDWSKLLALSKNNEVVAIVFSQCKCFIPQEYKAAFESAYSATLYYFANRQQLMSKIESSLSDVEHFTIKGASVATFYPVPAYRTMGDTDIVAHYEDREDVDKRLKSLGLECVSSFEDREWQYYFHDIEFELHDHLVYSESVNVDLQEKYFNDFWKYVHNNELDWNFHFLFLIFHLRKHFMNSGIGIRHFLDIAVLCSRGPDFDWAWIEAELKKLGLWLFAERVFALNKYWFEVEPPVAVEPLSEEFCVSATELILKNGIFGFDNEDNQDNSVVNDIRGKGNSHGAMLKNALRRLFPSYSSMNKVPHYSYLCGRPVLLPFAWVHRMFRSIANRRVKKNMKTLVDKSFTDQETIRKREEIYRQWGV